MIVSFRSGETQFGDIGLDKQCDVIIKWPFFPTQIHYTFHVYVSYAVNTYVFHNYPGNKDPQINID